MRQALPKASFLEQGSKCTHDLVTGVALHVLIDIHTHPVACVPIFFFVGGCSISQVSNSYS